jgi:16S rRNA (guanine966-N2)-methyltransferase
MKPGSVRIIAGQWRGRRLQVPDVQGLRPTPDRVRETLFNWLAPYIAGAYCLDLFAGSGVLGFEALSRGATYVEMVDQSAVVVKLLQTQLNVFAAENACIYQAEVPEGLKPVKRPFDIVFLDPPYQAHLLKPSCDYLEQHGYLAESAYIYMEAQHRIKDNELPFHWRFIKRKQAGHVAYHLAYREKK